MTRIVFDIMRFSIRDGPGIRTTVFFKGCPLDCWWCHNPEGCLPQPEVLVRAARCIHCGSCEEVCPTGAASGDGDCALCGKCVEACPSGAREISGREMTVSDIMDAVRRDRIFYEQSGGGVTFSGGEPLADPVFLEAVLEECAAEGIHAAVDTCGYVPASALLRLHEKVDLFLYDLKLMDDARHRRYTGVSNELILENLRELARRGAPIVVRMPVIPGVNDDEANTLQAGRYLSDVGLGEIQLLPYHSSAVEKYRNMRRSYRLPETTPPSPERLAEIARRLEALGLKVSVGG